MDVKPCKLLKLCDVLYVGRLAHLGLPHHDPFLADLPNDNTLPAYVSQLQNIAIDNPVGDLELLHPILLEDGKTPESEPSNQQEDDRYQNGDEHEGGFIVLEHQLAEFLCSTQQLLLVAAERAINYTLIDRLHLRQYFIVTF
jgi:hypothetical protein